MAAAAGQRDMEGELDASTMPGGDPGHDPCATPKLDLTIAHFQVEMRVGFKLE